MWFSIFELAHLLTMHKCTYRFHANMNWVRCCLHLSWRHPESRRYKFAIYYRAKAARWSWTPLNKYTALSFVRFVSFALQKKRRFFFFCAHVDVLLNNINAIYCAMYTVHPQYVLPFMVSTMPFLVKRA